MGINPSYVVVVVPTPMPLASGGIVRSSRFSVHLASRAGTQAGSVHKYRGDNVARMWMHLKR